MSNITSPYVIELPKKKRRYGGIDHDYDSATDEGLIAPRKSYVSRLDINECKESIARWQRYGHNAESYRSKHVAQRRIARVLTRLIELQSSGLAKGAIVQVYNDNRKAFMQERYTVTKVEKRASGTWYHLRNSVGRQLSPRQEKSLRIVS